MNQEIKQKWLEALRSGKYTQARDALVRRVDGKSYYCCLGVLCVLLDKDPYNIVNRWGHRINNGTLSQEILDEVGLNNFQQGRLADLNDCGADFEEIANYIEINY